jgi:hypothetical protein
MGTTPNPISSLPAGFELEEEKAASQSSALPPGFELETSPPPQPAAPSPALPQPAQAVQQAELNASNIANMLTRVGQQMQSGARAQIPHELRGYTPEELAQPGGFQNPRTGIAPSVGADLARVPIVDSPVEGGKQIIQGAEQAAEPDWASKAGGASKIIRGGMQMAEPALPGALAGAAVPTLLGLAGGAVAQDSVSGGLKKAGVPEPYADLAGDVAGVAGGGLTAHLAEGSGRISAFPPERATLDRQIEAPETKAPVGETKTPIPEPPAGFEVTNDTVPETAAPVPPPGFVVEPSTEGAKPGNTVSPRVSTSGRKAEGETLNTNKLGATPDDNRTAVSVDGSGQRAGTKGQESAQEGAGPAPAANGGSTEDQGQAAEEEALGEHQPDYLSGKPGVYHGFRAAPEGTSSGREDNGGTYIAQNREYANDYVGGNRVLHGARIQVDHPLVIDRPEHAELLARAEVDADQRNPQGAQRDAEIADLAKYYAEKGVHLVSPRAAEILRNQGYDAIAVKSDYVPAGDLTGPILIGLNPHKISLKRVEQTQGSLPERPAKTTPAYGTETTIRVPGEQNTYPARYAVREAEDVHPSHNALNFERNPQYDYENDRDYTQTENASRVVQNGHPGTFDPAFTTSESPTAEHGAPVLDQRGNALGGNSRTMTMHRVYEHNPQGATAYREALSNKVAGFGINPADLGRFKKPMLVRELSHPIDRGTAQKAITDFNKTAAAKLAPEEQAVADGRRLSDKTIAAISGNLAEVGEGSTLSQALTGDKGADIVQALIRDGVITPQEKNGFLDERGTLTGVAKDRIAKALVGRLFENSSDFGKTAPEVRNKLERIAPQVLRVEDRPEWSLTGPVREAVTALADAKAHGIKSLSDLNKQTDLQGKLRAYSPDAIAVARKLQEGPLKAQQAFRQYANDAEMSREGAQVGFFEPLTRHEAFEGAFGEQQPITALASRRRDPLEIPKTAWPREAYKLKQSIGFHVVRAQAHPIPLPASEARRAIAVGANFSLMDVISRLSGNAPDNALGTGGLHISPRNAALAAQRFNQLTAGMSHPPAGMRQLAFLADEAARQGKSLVVVAQHERLPSAAVKLALEEELNHALQEHATGQDLLEHLGDSGVPFLVGKLGNKALRSLEQGGRYDFRSTGEASAEIGVRLMAENRHDELGLTLPQARSLAAHYVRSLRKEYGYARPKEIAQRVFDALRRPDQRGESQPSGGAGGAGSGRGGGTSASTGRNLSEAPEAVRPAELSGELGALPAGPATGGDYRAGERVNAAPVQLGGPADLPLHAGDARRSGHPGGDDIRGSSTGGDTTGGEKLPLERSAGGSPESGLAPAESSIGRQVSSTERRAGRSQGVVDSPRASSDQAGIFGVDESKQVAESAAGDRAKLEGQRLTAQLKAPLTREEQLKKLKPSSAKSQSDLFGDEPKELQGVLFSLSRSPEPDEEGKVNYSGLGAVEDVAVRNLSQLRRAAEAQAERGPLFAVKDQYGNIVHSGSNADVKTWVKEQEANPKIKGTKHWKVTQVHDPWSSTVEAAAWKSQAATTLHTAIPRIEKAMQGEWHMKDLQRGLIESNLIGKRQRWQNLADLAARSSDENLLGALPRQLPLLDVLQDRLGFPRNLADTATALASNGDLASLRKFLIDQYSGAAARVSSVVPAGEFQAMTHSPTMQAGLKIYKESIEAVMARAHAMNEGMFQDATGPWKTYYPLTPVTEEDHANARVGTARGYASPTNKANHFATGLSEAYDDSMEALRAKLMTAVRDGTKAAMFDALEGNGILTRLDPFEQAPERVVYAGQAYRAIKKEIAGPRTIIKDGKVTKIPATFAVLPEPFEKELGPILEKARVREKPVIDLLQKINSVAIAGPADAEFHSLNLLGTLAWNSPFLLPAIVSKAFTVPFSQLTNELRKMLDTDSLSQHNVPALMRLARIGALSDRFGSETYSQRYAEQMGAERHMTSGPWLYGPKGVDVRARIAMHNIATAINPDISDHDLHMWVNQLGTYSAPLQSGIVRWIKKTRMGPFAEAGTAMMRNGINAWTGMGPIPIGGGKGAALRAYRMLTTGAIAAVALWAIAYKAKTGKLPWNDKRARLFEIPVSHEERYSKLGRARWGNGPETGYVQTTFWNPLVARGARALGIKDAVDTKLAGGTNWQALEAAQRGIMNSLSHPFMGPIPRALFVGLTGAEPHLTDLRNDRGQFSPQLMPAVKNPGGNGGTLKRPLAAVRELNPTLFDLGNAGVTSMEHFFGNTAYHSGIGEKGGKGDEWFRMLTDYVLPGVLGEAQNPAKKTHFLKQQAAAAKRQR